MPSTEWWVVAMVGLAFAVRLVIALRLPAGQRRPNLVLAVVGLSSTAAVAYGVDGDAKSIAALALMAVLLVVPGVALRRASQSLTLARPRQAKFWARVGQTFWPFASVRRLRRTVDEVAAIQMAPDGEQLDVDEAVRRIAPPNRTAASVTAFALHSWQNDRPRMRALLEDPSVLAAARRGLPASVFALRAESAESVAALRVELVELLKSPALRRPDLQARYGLLHAAAHLAMTDEFDREMLAQPQGVLPGTFAAWRSIAHARKGEGERAGDILSAALRAPTLQKRERQALVNRLETPLLPLDASFASAETGPASLATFVEEVRHRLSVRRTLAPLGLSAGPAWPLTGLLLASIAGAFLVQIQATRVFQRFGLIAPFGDAPDWWRLFSYGWLHVDAGHLLMNAVGLFVFGRFVERHYRLVRMAVIYMVGIAAGGAAFLFFASRPSGAVGASGAVMALFGATLARLTWDHDVRRHPRGRRQVTLLFGVIGLQLVTDMLWVQSSASAHAGGMASGVLLGYLLKPRS